MGTTIVIKRSELYRLVWQAPITKLAKTYGLSDVGLAKICRKYNIPRRPRGYWARRQHGQQPKIIPLPIAESDDEIELRDAGANAQSAATSPEAGEPQQIIELKCLKISVADNLRGAHELVRRANQELKTAGTDRDGLIQRGQARVLDIQVCKASLRRALLLLDALLKRLESRG